MAFLFVNPAVETPYTEAEVMDLDVPDAGGCGLKESEVQTRDEDKELQSGYVGGAILTNAAKNDKYYIVNAYTSEYLGQSTSDYFSPNQPWCLTTSWATQRDKSCKFLWFLEQGGSECKIVNVATGYALQAPQEMFNGVGDHVVTTTLDINSVFCKWLLEWTELDDEVNGKIYTINNVGTGFTLGASKKEFNEAGDHHVLSSPRTKEHPSFKKWLWCFVRV